jgi:hypothetical protein
MDITIIQARQTRILLGVEPGVVMAAVDWLWFVSQGFSPGVLFSSLAELSTELAELQGEA